MFCKPGKVIKKIIDHHLFFIFAMIFKSTVWWPLFTVAIFGYCHRSIIAVNPDEILILMVDNRPFERDFHTNSSDSYVSRSCVMNFEYAKLHGYSFAVVRPEEVKITNEMQQKYFLSEDAIFKQQEPHLKTHVGWASAQKTQAASFNVQLRQFRASPWSRLPVIWLLSKLSKYVHHSQPFNNASSNNFHEHHKFKTNGTVDQLLMRNWKYILYMDSDAVINPEFFNQSLTANIDVWRNLPKSDGTAKPFDETCLVFFSNLPYNSWPCTGIFLVDLQNPHTSDLLLEWWNFNDAAMNWVHEYEQEAFNTLWMRYKWNTVHAHTTLLTSVRQFAPFDHYFTHLSSAADRYGLLANYTQLDLNWTQSRYTADLALIERNHMINIPLLPITEMMAIDNETELSYIMLQQSHTPGSLAYWLLHGHRHHVDINSKPTNMSLKSFFFK
jgi:hypothetical protein